MLELHVEIGLDDLDQDACLVRRQESESAILAARKDMRQKGRRRLGACLTV
jgi:hypothetical protein